MYQRVVKRLFDFFFALLCLLLLAPLLLVLALLVKLGSKGPVFFVQKRVGKNGALFNMYKFRTMYADTPRDVPTHLLADPQARITKMGRFLRRTSLDELPQLFHILAGSMSLIGPRPALWNQDDLVAAREQYGANGLRPGLTGWAQINGRDELPIPQKAALDGYYAQNISFALDAKIFFSTIRNVLTGRGVVEGNQAATPDATGEPPVKKPAENGPGS